MSHSTALTRNLLSLALASVLCASAQAASPVTVTPGAWSAAEPESAHDFKCPSDQVLSGRVHQGDENGDTRYRCASLDKDGTITVGGVHEAARFPENKGTRFVCPDGEVMTGRGHQGNEEGDSWYACGTPQDPTGAPLQVSHDSEWIRVERENGGDEAECASNKVMVGRFHEGDETGPTEYLCAGLQ